MIEADGIEAISISYTAGVAAAALTGLGPSEFSFLLLIGAALLALDCAVHREGPKFRGNLMLFLLGAFSFSCANIPQYRPQLFIKELEWTKMRIQSIPFADKNVNHILTALLTGDRNLVDKDTVRAFRESGAAHILALSGMHLGIIYGILGILAKPLGKSGAALRIRSIFIIAFCALYTALTGAGPSLVRALLFIILREISSNNRHRRRDSGKLFCTALLLQLNLDPLSIKSLSFQLSYLAMTGICFVYPALHNWYAKACEGKIPKFSIAARIWDTCALSVSCQIFTGPLAWLRFGVFPKYFLLTNLLCLPLSEALILCGLACFFLNIAGITVTPLVTLTGWLCRTLEYCLEVIAGM